MNVPTDRSITAVFAGCLLPAFAMGQTTFQQSHYSLINPAGDTAVERAGYAYENRAYPAAHVDYSRHRGAAAAFDALSSDAPAISATWKELGPFDPVVAAPATYTGRPAKDSGRITALAISHRCVAGDCRLYVGAAGGGIWLTADALAATPAWVSSNQGIATTAIGSLVVDPTDASGQTLYAGTGEGNGASDAEAGLGLYKSTDGGSTWSLVSGSLAVAHDRSVAAVAVDPRDGQHIFIGTAVARHGSSAVNGGRFTPPNAPTIGLYESQDGGQTFALAFSLPSDPVVPTTANGNDFFRGGVSQIQVDPTSLGEEGRTRIYLSVFDYGLYRSAGAGGYEQVFASAGGGAAGLASSTSRTAFALAALEEGLRIYLADSGTGAADFYRVDHANGPASELTSGGINTGWIKLSSSTRGTPGFGSYSFCGGQCWYDMVVASPPGRPDIVYIGGQMKYGELGGPSNGRAVQRSTDAGVSFTDMTNDTQVPPYGMHPDQHAAVFAPGPVEIGFFGSDGGLVRTSGAFADHSSDCSAAARKLGGADLVDCQGWLKAIPTQVATLNDGLRTLQFQSMSFNPNNPIGDLIGGTQDNGTWAYDGSTGNWFESIGGDGGSSGISLGTMGNRMHTYTSAQVDVNFAGDAPLGWDWVADPLVGSREAASFYVPLIADPAVAATWFVGAQHVWRTQDDGGQQAYLDVHCNEYFGDFTVPCGDWVALGGPGGSGNAGDLVGSGYGTDKSGSYVVWIARSQRNSSTMWVATRRGRLFVSDNADAFDPTAVTFQRIDTAAQPTRFISAIAVDPADPRHAFVSFCGYSAYTPTTPGHIFDVRYHPGSGSATWTDLSFNFGDQPVTGIAFDAPTRTLYAATDFGVASLRLGSQQWHNAAPGLPQVAVYAVSIDSAARALYVATHGRGIWSLVLPSSE
ncbi:MAG TPA: hypothetical protein VH183_01310 [Burkholderiaceae bacterium]|nr:hypothetical protein [Burkholderiaceae bacterium]